jgi:ADP-ribose pyrophosphatase YjhB (NUDIX family)
MAVIAVGAASELASRLAEALHPHLELVVLEPLDLELNDEPHTKKQKKEEKGEKEEEKSGLDVIERAAAVVVVLASETDTGEGEEDPRRGATWAGEVFARIRSHFHDQVIGSQKHKRKQEEFASSPLFCAVLSPRAVDAPEERWELFATHGANCVTTDNDAGVAVLARALDSVGECWQEAQTGTSAYKTAAAAPKEGHNKKKSSTHKQKKAHQQAVSFLCPYCGLGPLSEDALWKHAPLFHVHEKNPARACPVCTADCTDTRSNPLGVHLFNQHGPVVRGEHPGDEHGQAPSLYAFALVVCRHPDDDKKFLAVQEFCGKGYWLPGGKVDRGESLTAAAIRETEEEAGVLVDLKGVLALQYSPHARYTRLRVVFYAEVADTDPPQRKPSRPLPWRYICPRR